MRAVLRTCGEYMCYQDKFGFLRLREYEGNAGSGFTHSRHL